MHYSSRILEDTEEAAYRELIIIMKESIIAEKYPIKTRKYKIVPLILKYLFDDQRMMLCRTAIIKNLTN